MMIINNNASVYRKISTNNNYGFCDSLLGDFFLWSCCLSKSQEMNAHAQFDDKPACYKIGYCVAYYPCCECFSVCCIDEKHNETLRDAFCCGCTASGCITAIIGIQLPSIALHSCCECAWCKEHEEGVKGVLSDMPERVLSVII